MAGDVDAPGPAPGRSRASDDWASVRAVLAGDRQAFAPLVERYQRAVFNLCLRYTGQRQDAEDLTQEAFLRAFRALGRYDSRRPFSAWLFAIAANACRDWSRRQASRARAAELEDAPPLDPDPAKAAERRDSLVRVAAALRELPADERLLVLLVHHQGFSLKEAAGITGLTAAAVKARLFRARRKLRQRLATFITPPAETRGQTASAECTQGSG
ncbi:MAG: RNA polymerase sigma factor [Firmicutes bacterium]|nr:RNA polymerase sigma factor [Bacillota bacterium]